MGQAAERVELTSVAEYLEFERAARVKHEYVGLAQIYEGLSEPC